jgi:hypothetical protein
MKWVQSVSLSKPHTNQELKKHLTDVQWQMPHEAHPVLLKQREQMTALLNGKQRLM